MAEFVLLLVCLVAFLWGLATFLRARKARASTRPALVGLLGGPLLFLAAALVVGSREPAVEPVAAASESAAMPTEEPPPPLPLKPDATVDTPELPPVPVEAEPAPEAPAQSEPIAPVETPEAAPPVSSDLQNLAVIAGRSEDDAELNAQYERLVALCPPEGPSVGDMAVNLQQLVKRESGRDMDIVDVMRQLATAQEGGVTMGMKCSETGGMLAELLIKGL